MTSEDTEKEKLSTRLSDANPYKKQLEAMEKPEDRHPLYEAAVKFLLVYVYIYFAALMYMGTPHIVVTLFLCFFLAFSSLIVWRSYKKHYMLSQKLWYRVEKNVVTLIMLFLSVVAWALVSVFYANKSGETGISELLMILVNPFADKARAFCAFFAIATLMAGISVNYVDCPYSLYKVMMSANRRGYNFPINEVDGCCSISLFVCFLGLFWTFGGILNFFHATFDDKGESILIGVLYVLPNLIINSLLFKKYYKAYEKGMKLENKQ